MTKLHVGDLITTRMIEALRPCKQQLGIFKARYPKGVHLTTRNLNRARTTHRLNTMWFIKSFLRFEYNSALDRLGFSRHTDSWKPKQARAIHSKVIRILKEQGGSI